MRSIRPSGRFAAATAVLLLHGLLILLFLRTHRGAKTANPQEEVHASILHLLSLPWQRPQAPGREREATRRGRGDSRIRIVPLPLRVTPAPNVAIPYGQTIDWHEAADAVARSVTSRRGRKAPPGSGAQPPSPYADCAPQEQFAWDPEPKRVGLIDHWLPYLRLGNHCIVTLGMFGCIVGRLPGPNGQLFEHLGGGKPKPRSTLSVLTWPEGEPRGLCRPSP